MLSLRLFGQNRAQHGRPLRALARGRVSQQSCPADQREATYSQGAESSKVVTLATLRITILPMRGIAETPHGGGGGLRRRCDNLQSAASVIQTSLRKRKFGRRVRSSHLAHRHSVKSAVPNSRATRGITTPRCGSASALARSYRHRTGRSLPSRERPLSRHERRASSTFP